MLRSCCIIYLCQHNTWYNTHNKMPIGMQEGRKGEKEETERKREGKKKNGREKGKKERKEERWGDRKGRKMLR